MHAPSAVFGQFVKRISTRADWFSGHMNRRAFLALNEWDGQLELSAVRSAKQRYWRTENGCRKTTPMRMREFSARQESVVVLLRKRVLRVDQLRLSKVDCFLVCDVLYLCKLVDKMKVLDDNYLMSMAGGGLNDGMLHEDGGYGTAAGAQKNGWLAYLRRNGIKKPQHITEEVRRGYYEERGVPVPRKKPKRVRGVRRYGEAWRNASNEEKKAMRAEWRRIQPIIRKKSKKPRKKPVSKKQARVPVHRHVRLEDEDVELPQAEPLELSAEEAAEEDRLAEIADYEDVADLNAHLNEEQPEEYGLEADRAALFAPVIVPQLRRRSESKLSLGPPGWEGKNIQPRDEKKARRAAAPSQFQFAVPESEYPVADIELKQALWSAAPARGKKRKSGENAVRTGHEKRKRGLPSYGEVLHAFASASDRDKLDEYVENLYDNTVSAAENLSRREDAKLTIVTAWDDIGRPDPMEKTEVAALYATILQLNGAAHEDEGEQLEFPSEWGIPDE